MKKFKDPALEEVRAARMSLSAEFDHDLDKVISYLRERQKQHTGRLVLHKGHPGRGSKKIK